MRLLTRTPWVLAVSWIIIAAAALFAGCESDGVTPNCSPDGGDCLTAPGDANPGNTTDAGTH